MASVADGAASGIWATRPGAKYSSGMVPAQIE